MGKNIAIPIPTKTIADMRFELKESGINPRYYSDEEIVQIYNKTLTDIPIAGITRAGVVIEVKPVEQ